MMKLIALVIGLCFVAMLYFGTPALFVLGMYQAFTADTLQGLLIAIFGSGACFVASIAGLAVCTAVAE